MHLRISVTLLFFGLNALAQPLSSTDELALRKLISSYADAHNKHDAAAASRLFTRDSQDRQSVVKSISEEPRVWTEKTAVFYQVKSIRSIHSDVALADVTLSWFQSGTGAGNSERMMVAVRENGVWKISTDRRICQDSPLKHGAPDRF